MIASRLPPLIPNIIPDHQEGFVQGHEARDNTNKTLLLISHVQRNGIPACLLSVDTEKAFDRVHWAFLHGSLTQIRIGPSLVGKIMASYESPSARVMTNGMLSSSVHVANGTRQGCPLSPLLYVLVMEHLAVALRSNPDIHGITAGTKQHKLTLYTDNLLLYLTDPLSSLPNIFREF